jgi:DNA-binding NarL/FixJ family response regulator
MDDEPQTLSVASKLAKPETPHAITMSPRRVKIRVSRPTPRRAAPQTSPPATVAPRLVIVEDQAAIREMIVELLGRPTGPRVVGAAASGPEGLAMVARLEPDVVVLDIQMPGMGGIEFLRRLRRTSPRTKVLVFSARQEAHVIRNLVQEGIQGYVNKAQTLTELRQAVAKVGDGGSWFDEAFSQTVREALANPRIQSDRLVEQLTPREREIALLIAGSHSSKEVAHRLGLSIKTAENHRSNLMRKLGVHDVAGLVRYLVRQGLVDPTNE